MRRISAKRPANLLRRFRKERKGATAIEFALIALPFFLMLLGTLEIALVQLSRSSMNHAMEKASRQILTGEAGCVSHDDFIATLCSHIRTDSTEGCKANTKAVLMPITDFASAPAHNSGKFDSISGSVDAGSGSETMLLRTYVKWDTYVPMLAPLLGGDDGEFVLLNNHAWRNEPFQPPAGC